MKKVAGTLKLAYSQFRELQAFSQFGSDLDADTKKRLEQGARIVEVLKQPQNSPIPGRKAGYHHLCRCFGRTARYSGRPDQRVREGAVLLRGQRLRRHSESIRTTGKLEDDVKEKLTKAIEECKSKFLSEH